MNAVSFDAPWLLLGLVIFILFFIYDYSSKNRKHIKKNLPRFLQMKLTASRACFRIFLACMIIALAGPHWGTGGASGESRIRSQTRRAVDAVIALDVSRSMEVPDSLGGMTRMERGLAIIKEAVVAVPGARFAVAVSRNQGIVSIPLTWDADALLSFLDAADSSLTGRGTNLESLVDTAAGVFQSSSPSARVILLVSDGEALSGSLKTALERCKREGIAVYAIAVGSDAGGIVPENEDIISRRDAAAMKMAAGQTGGFYIDGNQDDAPRSLVGHLRTLAPGSEMRGAEKEAPARWFIFVILGIISFGASKLCLLKMRE